MVMILSNTSGCLSRPLESRWGVGAEACDVSFVLWTTELENTNVTSCFIRILYSIWILYILYKKCFQLNNIPLTLSCLLITTV